MLQKIAFMGTPNFAVPILKNIYQNGYEISAVYTQPPRKSNRDKSLKNLQFTRLLKQLALILELLIG